MNHKRIKTAHYENMQLFKKSGLTWDEWQRRVALRMQEALRERRASLSVEMQRAIAAKEKKRPGWKSSIKDKRL